jgi:membrane protein implicated in regulation of membrane protease activity
MDPWVVWLIATGVLVVAEILTTSLVFGLIAGGTASAALVAALGGSAPLQVGAFALVSFALLVVVRPIAQRHLHTPSKIRTGVAALVGAGPDLARRVQVGAFALVSFALLVVVRPIAQRHLHTPSKIRTGVAALVGAEAEVVAAVDARDGRVKLSGEIWSARSYDGESAYQPGTVVRVVEISGATALVA